MHNLQGKLHAFIFFFAFLFTTSIFMATPHQLEATDVKATDIKAKAVTKLEQKKEAVKEKHKKHKGKASADKKAEEKAPEVKKEEVKPTPPPAPITPDKKKYASPGGYQVMTDGSVVNFRSMGVIYMHGYKYTYYSSRVLYHYKTPEWYACDDHIYRTADGYIVVASGSHPMGAIVPTPFGKGKVLDRCHVAGVIDIYVNF